MELHAKIRLTLVAAAMLGVAACGRTKGESGTTATDTLTRRQKDSLLSTVPYPGAGRILDAQSATDRANARALQHDTMR